MALRSLARLGIPLNGHDAPVPHLVVEPKHKPPRPYVAKPGRRKDLTGRVFGQLVVIEFAGMIRGRTWQATWRCRCSCGTETVVRSGNLQSGTTLSCGCRKHPNGTYAERIKDGQRFGMLVVVGKAGADRWKARCDCGNEVTLRGGELMERHSCGCEGGGFKVKHGHAGSWEPGRRKQPRRKTQPSPEYLCWAAMIQRCTNPKSKSWKHYGGRSSVDPDARDIKVCQRWLDSFEAFLADMGVKPSPELTIERINNDGDYEPGNCKWATWAEQRANQRPRRQRSAA
jgi:hypothetical protein